MGARREISRSHEPSHPKNCGIGTQNGRFRRPWALAGFHLFTKATSVVIRESQLRFRRSRPEYFPITRRPQCSDALGFAVDLRNLP